MTAVDINQRLYARPFKPFRIRMSDGSSLPVTGAAPMLVGESFIIVPTEMGHDSQGYPLVKRWRTVALSHLVQLSDIDEPVGGRRKKRK